MKKAKAPIYFRYEFSDEVGQPEGGDIFEFPSFKDALAMAADILKVAQGDKVAVNLTVGTEKPFFGYLGNSGLSRKAAEKEMVNQADIMPAKGKAAKAKPAKAKPAKAKPAKAPAKKAKTTRKK
ncbi:MAG: hypothetical protein ABIQ95_03640 [Bdellovibrionia bacterium]